jgi:hypothetical protein
MTGPLLDVFEVGKSFRCDHAERESEDDEKGKNEHLEPDWRLPSRVLNLPSRFASWSFVLIFHSDCRICGPIGPVLCISQFAVIGIARHHKNPAVRPPETRARGNYASSGMAPV